MTPLPRNTTFLLLGAAALLGCDALRSRPGHDFAVRLVTPTPVTAISQVTVPLDIEVAGCDAFAAELHNWNGPTRALDFANRGGTWRADVPAAWLRGENNSCEANARLPQPYEMRLEVTCGSTGQVGRLDFDVMYGTSTRVVRQNRFATLSPVQYLFSGDDPFDPFQLAPSLVDEEAVLLPSLYYGPAGGSREVNPIPSRVSPAYGRNALARPRQAKSDSALVFTAGCLTRAESYGGYFPYPTVSENCPPIVLPGATLASESLWGIGWRPGGDHAQNHGWLPVWVPGQVLDLAVVADRKFVVLSQEYTSSGSPGGTVVTGVILDPPIDCPAGSVPCRGTSTVKILAYYPAETVQTRFARAPDGRLAFATLVWPAAPGPIRAALHTTDGDKVEAAAADPAGDVDLGAFDGTARRESIGTLQLSPDASQVVVNGTLLGPPGGPWHEFESPSNARSPGLAQAAWLDGALARWQGGDPWSSPLLDDVPLWMSFGAVAFYDPAPPHAEIGRHEVHSITDPWNGHTVLWGAVAVADKLVLTTSTGVRILNRQGQVVGGADPLPCGLAPTSLAIRSGPTTAAVRAGPYLYVFDVAGTP